jgi:hypothetical protein
MPSGCSRWSTKAIFPTIVLAFLALGLFVLTGGCESRPGLVPPPIAGFVGPSNRDKVIVFIHGVTASNEKSWKNPITASLQAIQSELRAQSGQPI